MKDIWQNRSWDQFSKHFFLLICSFQLMFYWLISDFIYWGYNFNFIFEKKSSLVIFPKAFHSEELLLSPLIMLFMECWIFKKWSLVYSNLLSQSFSKQKQDWRYFCAKCKGWTICFTSKLPWIIDLKDQLNDIFS